MLSLALKAGTKPSRLVELLHRAVPYPVLLFTEADGDVGISLAHLRTAQNEADKTVLDGGLLNVALPSDADLQPFRTALALARQPQADLYALYQGWLDTLDALDIARETGAFQPSLTRAQAAEKAPGPAAVSGTASQAATAARPGPEGEPTGAPSRLEPRVAHRPGGLAAASAATEGSADVTAPADATSKHWPALCLVPMNSMRR